MLVGDDCHIGANSCVACGSGHDTRIGSHVKIGNGVKIGALSGVMNDQPDGAAVLGQPAIPVREFWRQLAAIRRLGTKKGTDT